MISGHSLQQNKIANFITSRHALLFGEVKHRIPNKTKSEGISLE